MLAFCRSVRAGVSWDGNSGCVLRGGAGPAFGVSRRSPARELIRYFTLTESDETFVRRFRGPANVLGASVQLCTLPWLGFVPDDARAAPAVAVARLAERLHVAAGGLSGYAVRGQTRTDHLHEVQRYARLFPVTRSTIYRAVARAGRRATAASTARES
jgi:hypothetical protein